MVLAAAKMHNATVLRVAGRSLQLFDGAMFAASIASRAVKPIVGDIVSLDLEEGQGLVRAITDRRNCLTRTFGTRDKEIVSNLDRLFVVTAVGALFNTAVIDRVLSIAWRESVPVTLVMNKVDLGRESRIEIYRQLGFETLELSAKFGEGFESLQSRLQLAETGFVALCGVSGAGKSTILNRLVPDAARKTAEVSLKTGQGRQTTSETIAYLYERAGLSPLIVADLPGVQFFGVSHLTMADVALSFPELSVLREHCQYGDCFHIAEPECAVKSAVQTGQVAQSRYESYVSMITELRELPEARKYRKRSPGSPPRPLHSAFKGVKDSRE